MDAFLVFAPVVLDREHGWVKVGEDHPVTSSACTRSTEASESSWADTGWTPSGIWIGTHTTSPPNQ